MQASQGGLFEKFFERGRYRRKYDPKIFLTTAAIALMSFLFPVIMVLFFTVTSLFLISIRFAFKTIVAFSSSKVSKRTNKNIGYRPFVSIHIACCNEPSELVVKTLHQLKRINYSSYEVLVIHNNNKKRENWKKIEKSCKELGSKFKFYHEDKISGYKAGALNYLIEKTAHKAEIIAVIDCDYIVNPNFLAENVEKFLNPKISMIQSPQDYFANDTNVGLRAEYRSFFSSHMNHAQICNAVLFTGTMGLIRASILRAQKKWNPKCITEDAELGIEIQKRGYRGLYIDKSYGKGLMPFSFASLVKQRKRWSFGNMQVLKSNLLQILRSKHFSKRQKLSFVSQLTAWFDFDLQLAFFYVYTKLMHIYHPSLLIDLCGNVIIFLIGVSIITNLIFFLRGLNEDFTIIDRIKAFLVHYGLVYTMSVSWLNCLLGKKLQFEVTPKSKGMSKSSMSNYFEEYLMPTILVLGLILGIYINPFAFSNLIIIIFISLRLYSIWYLKLVFKKS